MYVSTKSIVTEIREGQEALKKQIEEYDTGYHEILSEIDRKLSEANQNILNLQIGFSDIYKVLLERIDGIENQLSVLQNRISTSEEMVKAGCQETVSSIKQDIIQEYTQHGELVKQTLRAEAGKLQEEIKKKCSDVDEQLKTTADLIETSTRTISDSIIEKSQGAVNDICDRSNSNISELSSHIESTIESWRNFASAENRELKEEMEAARDAINVFKEDILNEQKIVGTNVEAMNHGIQEILRNLMTLDEANRLIIAKFLLKDLVI